MPELSTIDAVINKVIHILGYLHSLTFMTENNKKTAADSANFREFAAAIVLSCYFPFIPYRRPSCRVLLSVGRL